MDLLFPMSVVVVVIVALAWGGTHRMGARASSPSPISSDTRGRILLTNVLGIIKMPRGRIYPNNMTEKIKSHENMGGLEYSSAVSTDRYGVRIVAVKIENPPPPVRCSFCGQMTQRVETEYSVETGMERVRLVNLPGDRCANCSALAEEEVIFYNERIGQIIERLVPAA